MLIMSDRVSNWIMGVVASLMAMDWAGFFENWLDVAAKGAAFILSISWIIINIYKIIDRVKNGRQNKKRE